MPASILPQNQDEKELFNAISSFFSRFKIGNLLRACNAQKEKGVPVTRIFKYKLCNVFTGRSMYMQQRTGSFRESFSAVCCHLQKPATLSDPSSITMDALWLDSAENLPR